MRLKFKVSKAKFKVSMARSKDYPTASIRWRKRLNNRIDGFEKRMDEFSKRLMDSSGNSKSL